MKGILPDYRAIKTKAQKPTAAATQVAGRKAKGRMIIIIDNQGNKASFTSSFE